MIDKTAVIATVLIKLKKLPISHYLDLQTYKKDRSVVIVKKSDDDFLVIEKGYDQEEFKVNAAKLKKTLKALLKKEFPKSKKVRLYSGVYES